MQNKKSDRADTIARVIRYVFGPKACGLAAAVVLTAAIPVSSVMADQGEDTEAVSEEGSEDEGLVDAEKSEAAVSTAGDEADQQEGEKSPEKEEDDKTEPTMAPTLGEDATPEERAALRKYQKAFARYKRESQDYQKTVDGIVQSKYRQKVAEVQERYNRRIDELTAVERQRRTDAIASLKAFIERYPNNAKYTPDALFRLAELQFEKANDDYLIADEQFQEKIVQYERGKIPDMPSEPIRDYSPTIETFATLIEDWPEYRFLDGAYYLSGYCHLQMGQEEQAKNLFATLIEERPESEFIPEAWIRIGEYFFDLNDLESAKLAYAKAMNFPESRFFDKALYKLAWTHYRQDEFEEAIQRFKELVEYSDEQMRKTGQSGSVLRAESVQYIAISLAENDWDADGITDEAFGLERVKQYLPGQQPYEREALVQLVEYLFESNYFGRAIRVSRYALNAYPMHPENPQLHEQMVLAMFRDDEMGQAFEERRQLGAFYGPGSDWYRAQENKGNVEAMRYASNLIKDNLIQSATWFHEQAQKQRDEAIVQQDEAMLAASKRKYELAAKTYAEFLRKHPNDKDAYQWNYYYAETLFYSDQFYDAYEQYRVVREMDLRDDEFFKIQETTAFNAIKSIEEVIEEKVAAGEVPGKLLPGGAQSEVEKVAESEAVDPDAGPAQITAEPLPPIARRYVTAMDRYVVLGLKNPEDPNLDSKFAFQAAKIFYDFNDFPEARRRFEWIIGNYASEQVGQYAASLLLETYRLEQDYDMLAEKAGEVQKLLPEGQGETIRQEIAEYELASLFKAAEKAYAEKRYEDAIEKYKEMMSRDTEQKYTTLALINTAVAYEALDKPGEAANYYERLYTEFPDDDFVPYAIYRVAVNTERFFEFDKATQNYLAFYDRFADEETPEEVRKAFSGNFIFREKATDALRSGAVLLENSQEYREAADRYVEYSERYPTKDDADDVFWQAIKSWEKAGNERRAVRGYEEYIDTHGSAQNSKKVFEALGAIADYHAERGDEREARKWYERTLEEYVTYQIKPGSPEAFWAAKSQFMLIEDEFEKWDSIQFTGSLKSQQKKLQEKIEGQKKLTSMYDQVYAYRSLEWTMAAGFRQGHLFQRFANTLYEADVPFPEGTEQWDVYRGKLDDIAIPLEDKAIENYVKIVEKARNEKIVNEWTKRALEELNKYRPSEYPLYKEERRATTDTASTGIPYLDSESYKKRANPTPSKEEQ